MYYFKRVLKNLTEQYVLLFTMLYRRNGDVQTYFQQSSCL